MTYVGIFEEAEKLIYLKNQNKFLKKKLKDAVTKLKNLDGLEEIHRKNNGDLRVHITKLEKEIFQLKKDNKILEEGNEALGIVFKKD